MSETIVIAAGIGPKGRKTREYTRRIAKKRAPSFEESFAFFHPKTAKRFSPNSELQPHEIFKESHKSVTLVCQECESDFTLTASRAPQNMICKNCNDYKRSLQFLAPELANRLLPTSPTKANEKLTKKSRVDVRCDLCSYEKIDVSAHKAMYFPHCKSCGVTLGRTKPVALEESFAYLHPELLSLIAVDKDQELDFTKVSPTSSKKIVAHCRNCGKLKHTNISNLVKTLSCKKCVTTTFVKTSKGERELAEFLRSLDLEVNTSCRKLIRYPVTDSPLELDITIEELGLAIEYNGVHWHSSASQNMRPGYWRKMHQLKWGLAASAGFEPFFVWEDDWVKDKEKTKSTLESFIAKRRAGITAPIPDLFTRAEARDDQTVLAGKFFSVVV